MPYITADRRQRILRNAHAETAGDLNYAFTNAIIKYINNKGLKYQTINDVVGALDSCKMEFNRRVVVLYEDKKIKSNGDVYDDLLKDSHLGV